MGKIEQHLADHRFRELFIEPLGWDWASSSLFVSSDGQEFHFEVIAQKRGFQVLHCKVDRLTIINRGLLRRVQRRVTASALEHILIYSSDDPPRQVWQWAVHLPDGRRLRHREHPFFSHDAPSKLLKHLTGLRFSLDEEDDLTLVDALERVRQALDTSAELNLFARRPTYAAKSDALAAAIQNGDHSAFERFVLFHHPLVQWVARQVRKQLNIDLEDAEQIGVLGLIHAAKRFDRSRGLQFSTYATHCIEGFCKRHGPPAAQLIRIPPHVYWPCVKVRSRLLRAGAAGPARVQQSLARLRKRDPDMAKSWRRFQRVVTWTSLSDRTQPEYREARNLIDPSDGPLEQTIRIERIEGARIAIARLHDRPARIIRLRYGIEGPPLTLEQIGHLMGVTRERVRQVQESAEERLRQLIVAEMPSLADAGETEAPCSDEDVVAGIEHSSDDPQGC